MFDTLALKREIWPTFFIVGAHKSGTTSLYEYLKPIPEIFMCPIKEPNYFSPDLPQYYLPIYDKKKYLNLFKRVKNELAIGEASTTYLYNPETPNLIREVIPEARIIITLRDPIERAYTHYFMEILLGTQKSSFHDSIIEYGSKPENEYNHTPEFIKNSFYADHVKRYLETFGHERVKILLFEEFIKDEKAAVKNILAFLGLNINFELTGRAYGSTVAARNSFARFVARNVFVRKLARAILPENVLEILRTKLVFKEIKKPPMLEEDRLFLQKLYRDDVWKLEKVLGRPLPWSWYKN